jgi:hypothetical protein
MPGADRVMLRLREAFDSHMLKAPAELLVSGRLN